MHDLWILPTPRTSRWFARLDWYLNWQMCKGLAYAGLHLPEETMRVADAHGVPVPAPPDPAQPAPLLILPGPRVPAKRCLVMDDRDEDLRAWLKRAAEQARRLGGHTARVFLPTGANVAQAEAAWVRLDTPVTASFAADLETAT